MTQIELAREIIDAVRFSDSDHEAMQGVVAFIDTLQPRDRFSFAEWGHPYQKSNILNCWPEKHTPDFTVEEIDEEE